MRYSLFFAMSFILSIIFFGTRAWAEETAEDLVQLGPDTSGVVENKSQESSKSATSQQAHKQEDIRYTDPDLFVGMETLIDREQIKKDPIRSYQAYMEVFHSGFTTEGHTSPED